MIHLRPLLRRPLLLDALWLGSIAAAGRARVVHEA